MSSSTIAPTVATTIDHTLNPVAPVPPKIPNTKPPTTAPTIPIMAVTIMPPGSSPGSTSLASAPAINPTTIQLMMPIFSLALLSEGLPLVGGRLHHHIPEPLTCLGDAIASPYSSKSKYLEGKFCELRRNRSMRSTSHVRSSEKFGLVPSLACLRDRRIGV